MILFFFLAVFDLSPPLGLIVINLGLVSFWAGTTTAPEVVTSRARTSFQASRTHAPGHPDDLRNGGIWVPDGGPGGGNARERQRIYEARAGQVPGGYAQGAEAGDQQ